MNYKKSIDWLYSFERFGIKLGLERIKYICDKLGNPQSNYRIIHVGGTNGKGSVCKFLESVLVNSGYKVGTYTSPHLQRFSERFIINKKEISESEIKKLVETIKPIIDMMVKENNIPTFFEIITAIAFLYFKENNVDFAIIEVGLGGRYDATNIINPMITIITNISLEHEKILGDTIEKISYEKAGIIKDEIPIITAATGKALDVIKKVALEKNSTMNVIDSNSWIKKKGGIDYQKFQVYGTLKEYILKTTILGKYQGENIAIAIAAIETLQMNGVYITDESIIESFLNTINPGRMEIAGFKPIILLDGAHNAAGMISLKNSLEEDFIYEKLILIIGILSDKNIKAILDIITPGSDIIILTKPQTSRASDPFFLKEMICKKQVIIKDKIKVAIEYAKKIAKDKDIICITGSLYTVGEARDYLL